MRTIDDLDTPALCIDLDVLESNIAQMAAACRRHGKAWRPHAKAHKSPIVARKQLEAGAIGVTCAKLGEAEVLAAGGVRDLLVANQLAGMHKMRRLAQLCRTADPVVAVDHVEQAQSMSQACSAAGVQVRVIVEVDIGLNRAGVAPGDAAVELAQAVDRLPGLRLCGIMGYEGHLLTVPDLEEKERRIAAALELLGQTRDALRRSGLCCDIVSAGGTGSYRYTLQSPHVTELQAGGLIFMDAFYRRKCQVGEFGHALTVLTTVVSRPERTRAIIDAGRKTHWIDHAAPIFLGFEEQIQVRRLSAEHGELLLEGEAQRLRIGDRLRFIPGYSDFTNVLHNAFYVLRGDEVVDTWPLEARGKLA
jgi:D-serine deaminase-like pyridoxal phosphate-dependent protein